MPYNPNITDPLKPSSTIPGQNRNTPPQNRRRSGLSRRESAIRSARGNVSHGMFESRRPIRRGASYPPPSQRVPHSPPTPQRGPTALTRTIQSVARGTTSRALTGPVGRVAASSLRAARVGSVGGLKGLLGGLAVGATVGLIAERGSEKIKNRNSTPTSSTPTPTPTPQPSFSDAFKQARTAGKSEFTWQGKQFHTRTKEEQTKLDTGVKRYQRAKQDMSDLSRSHIRPQSTDSRIQRNQTIKTKSSANANRLKRKF